MTKQVCLGDIFEFKNGRAFKKSEWSATGLPIIRIQNLNNQQATFNHYSGEYDKRIEVNTGDLLFSWSGTVGSSFGPHIWLGGKGVLNQHIFRVFLKDGIEKRYAYYALLEITSEIEKSVSGAVGIVHVTQSNLRKFKIPLPAIAEQKRIVAILDEAFAGIDTAIANTEKNLINARELFESYLVAVFSHEGVEWKQTTLGEVLEQQPRNGWSPPAKFHSDVGTPVLTLSAVTGFKFRRNKIKFTSAPTSPDKHYWVNDGDLLITRSNTPELVGHVAVAGGLTEPTIYPDLIMKMRPNPKEALTEFLYYQLRTPVLRGEITGRARGANPTMKKIGKQAVQSLPISVPSLSVQRGIVSRIEQIANETLGLENVLKVKLANLAELKQSLLQKAFSGELTADIVETMDREEAALA